MAVDYADAGAICQGGFVEEFVDAIGGFFDGGADDVDFIACGIVGGLRRDCYVEARRRGGRRSGRGAFDAGDLIDSDFHAERAGFDFGGVAVDATQYYRLAETADADFGAGLKTGCARRACDGSGNAEIGLRIGKSLHDGGVEFVAGFAAGILELAAGRFSS